MSEEPSISLNDSAHPFADADGMALPPPEIDLAPYLADLDDTDLNDDQKAEFLATLVSVVWHFVDLGFRGDISELLLSWADSDAVESSVSPKKDVSPPNHNSEEIAK